MLWACAALEVDRKLIVFAACQCARLALPHAKGPAALNAIETAERWTRGEATIEQVRQASAAAASAAASATYAAASAAYAAYYAAARDDTLRQCAAIVREHVPWKAQNVVLYLPLVPTNCGNSDGS